MAEICDLEDLSFVRSELERLVQLRFIDNWASGDEREYQRLSERERALLAAPRQLPLFEIDP